MQLQPDVNIQPAFMDAQDSYVAYIYYKEIYNVHVYNDVKIRK